MQGKTHYNISKGGGAKYKYCQKLNWGGGGRGGGGQGGGGGGA